MFCFLFLWHAFHPGLCGSDARALKTTLVYWSHSSFKTAINVRLYRYIKKSVPYPKSVSAIHMSGRGSLVSVSEADAEDNGVSCVTCVSCQQAASGAPKCTICDQVCHAIIPCITATDDENVLGHMNYAFDAREQQRWANRKQGLFFLTCLIKQKWRMYEYVVFTMNATSFQHSYANISCLLIAFVQSKARQNITLYRMCSDEIFIDLLV